MKIRERVLFLLYAAQQANLQHWRIVTVTMIAARPSMQLFKRQQRLWL